MTRPIRASVLALVTIVIVALVAACSSSATPGPSGAGGGGLGGALQSLGIQLPSNLPSLNLNLGSPGTLNGAPDLAAELPSTLCNAPATKSSIGAGLASALPDASLDPMIAAFAAM